MIVIFKYDLFLGFVVVHLQCKHYYNYVQATQPSAQTKKKNVLWLNLVSYQSMLWNTSAPNTPCSLFVGKSKLKRHE